MEECDICLSKTKNKNKEKHCLTKKHKKFLKSDYKEIHCKTP